MAADFDNPDGKHIVLNGINDTIISLPDPISLLAGKLFTTRWSQIFFNQIDVIDDELEVLFGNRVRVLADSRGAFL